MGQKYRHKNTSVSLINYHFVWCPRRRKKVLIGLVQQRLKQLIYEAALKIDIEVVALEVMPDHIHAFLNCPPTIAPSQVMHRIKGYTARYLRQEFSELTKLPSMWTRSYFCSTFGSAESPFPKEMSARSSVRNVSSATVERYIAQQKTRG